MTFRERIADWISGGELSDLIHDNERIIHSLTKETNARSEQQAALRTIAAMETPGANATVKRMAKVARGALDG